MPEGPEALAARHRRYFLAIQGDGVSVEEALELTKHYIHAEALTEAMRDRVDDLPPFTGLKKV